MLRGGVRFDRSNALRERFHALIPGGAHTYAKGDDQFPAGMAPYIVRGRGCRVWDVDGNEFIEYGAGLRAVGLGHAFAPVVEAARRQLELGANFARPSRIELECAETFLECVPAEMVKFCKDGSHAMSGAVKLARACTGRDCIGVCGSHPFFSVDDWFIGVSAMPGGVPQATRDLTLKFSYNDPDSLQSLFDQYPGRIAAVILEAEKDQPPADGFFDDLRQLCDRQGALLVLDEMITGFRWHRGGAQVRYGIEPDLCAFGKALGNGFSVSALAGRREFMQRGGGGHEHERVFLLSTTHGAEAHALAAAIATMRVYQREPVVETLWERGQQLKDGIAQAAAAAGVAEQVPLLGPPCCLVFGSRDAEGQPSQPYRTLLLQELIERGVLATSLVVNYSHTPAYIEQTIDAFAAAFAVYRRALEDGIEGYLRGRPVQPAIRPRD